MDPVPPPDLGNVHKKVDVTNPQPFLQKEVDFNFKTRFNERLSTG